MAINAKNVLAVYAQGGDVCADAVEAVKRYAEVQSDADSVAHFARSVARRLSELALALEYDPAEGPKNEKHGRGYVCPVEDGFIHADSHQADPCAHCAYIYHDRCFYTRKHPCVRAGLIEERKGYADKSGRAS